jgi:hypothetical protein
LSSASLYILHMLHKGDPEDWGECNAKFVTP